MHRHSNGVIGVIGGGAAGFFGAIHAASQGASVSIFEKASQPLGKVRISGGGRCNVTHACFDPRELSTRYPRGARSLIGAFHRFQPRDTMEWFEAHGVPLKIENDGRVFPTSNSSESVIEALQVAANASGVVLRTRTGITDIRRKGSHFELHTSNGDTEGFDSLLIASGGCRQTGWIPILERLGHRVIPPVPSLFAFELAESWPKGLSGVSLSSAKITAALSPKPLHNTGPVLFTHQGLSGPGILKLSAFGARELANVDYQFGVKIDWTGGVSPEELLKDFENQRRASPGKAIRNTPIRIPLRLWETLVSHAGIAHETRWAIFKKNESQALIEAILSTRLTVIGKNLNKEEFVTCGGVSLAEVDFRTMESRLIPGLYFAGEVLDIDGITGGFNFQAAWTTSWIAGHSMAARPSTFREEV